MMWIKMAPIWLMFTGTEEHDGYLLTAKMIMIQFPLFFLFFSLFFFLKEYMLHLQPTF